MIEFRTKFPELSHLKVVVITESNSRWDANIVADVLTSRGNRERDDRGRSLIGELEFLGEYGSKKFGSFKDRKKTTKYVFHMANALRENTFRVHPRVSTANPSNPDAEHMVKQLGDQFKQFRWPDVDRNNARHSMSSRISGKRFGSDDLAIAAMMLKFYSFEYFATLNERESFITALLDRKHETGNVYNTAADRHDQYRTGL